MKLQEYIVGDYIIYCVVGIFGLYITVSSIHCCYNLAKKCLMCMCNDNIESINCTTITDQCNKSFVYFPWFDRENTNKRVHNKRIQKYVNEYQIDVNDYIDEKEELNSPH